jgi:anthranilate phosphoribosyltransferase
VIRAVLAGRDGPALRVVLANAAAALLAAERVESLRQGVERAAAAVADGRAARALEALAAESNAE